METETFKFMGRDVAVTDSIDSQCLMLLGRLSDSELRNCGSFAEALELILKRSAMITNVGKF